MRYGVYPFWFWNGRMEEAEIIRQLDQMKRGNCRGAVIHARLGNRIEYLSSEWFSLVRCAAVHARKIGMKLWIYDEEGFPSGNAGGKVQRNHPELNQQALCFAGFGFDPASPGFETAAIHEYAPGVFRVEIDRHVDVFQRECAARFLKFTHEKYLEQLGEFFGPVIEAVYTDDESFLLHYIPGYVYSPVLEEEYRRRFGRTIRQDLEFLTEELPESGRVRARYFSLARDLFLENFIRPQKEWCRKHGLIYLGHLCGDEGPLAYSIRRYGTGGKYQRMLDVPSVDDFLCDLSDQRYLAHSFSVRGNKFLPLEERTSPLLLYKTGSSAANQFANGRFSAETLTFLGWDVTPDFIQKQMLFELGMGVNFLTHHACYYQIDETTRQDCPPSYFFQQPYWHLFSERNQCWTRIAELLQRGQSCAKHLVILPSVLLELPQGRDICAPVLPLDTPLAEAEEAILQTLLELMRSHVSFDIAEEEMISVQDGMIAVGDGRYESFSVPGGLALQPETGALLQPFAGNLPQSDWPELDPEILVNCRRNGDCKEYYLVNLSGRDLPLERQAGKPFSLYDPVNDEVIFRGCKLPPETLLRDGAAVMFLSGDFVSGRETELKNSVCAAQSPAEEIALTEMERTPEWILFEGTLPAGSSRLELESAHAAEIGVETGFFGFIFGKPHLLALPENAAGKLQVKLFAGAYAPPPPEPRLRVFRRG